jgi:hypothetical protein
MAASTAFAHEGAIIAQSPGCIKPLSPTKKFAFLSNIEHPRSPMTDMIPPAVLETFDIPWERDINSILCRRRNDERGLPNQDLREEMLDVY